MTRTYFFVFGLTIVAVLVYQKWARDRALKRLYAIKSKGSEEGFLTEVNSPYIKMTFNEYTRKMMLFNYWCDMGMLKKADGIIPDLLKQKLPKKEKVALRCRLYGYYLQNQEYPKAQEIKDELAQLLRKADDAKSKQLIDELELLDQVYLKRNTELLPALCEAFAQAPAGQGRAILAYRIAKLYYAKPDLKQVHIYLKLALENAVAAGSKRAIEEAMVNPALLR